MVWSQGDQGWSTAGETQTEVATWSSLEAEIHNAWSSLESEDLHEAEVDEMRRLYALLDEEWQDLSFDLRMVRHAVQETSRVSKYLDDLFWSYLGWSPVERDVANTYNTHCEIANDSPQNQMRFDQIKEAVLDMFRLLQRNVDDRIIDQYTGLSHCRKFAEFMCRKSGEWPTKLQYIESRPLEDQCKLYSTLSVMAMDEFDSFHMLEQYLTVSVADLASTNRFL